MTSWNLGKELAVILDPALVNMQVFLSLSSRCMGTQVSNSVICIVEACLHVLLSLWFLRVYSSGQSFENAGPVCPERRIEMTLLCLLCRKCGRHSQLCLAPDGVWSPARTE